MLTVFTNFTFSNRPIIKYQTDRVHDETHHSLSTHNVVFRTQIFSFHSSMLFRTSAKIIQFQDQCVILNYKHFEKEIRNRDERGHRVVLSFRGQYNQHTL